MSGVGTAGVSNVANTTSGVVSGLVADGGVSGAGVTNVFSSGISSFLLLETGDFVLYETGDKIILEA